VNERLGERIRSVREQRILTQEEVAAELDVPARSLQDYEAGRATPRQARRRKILAWLAEHETVAA
jgi:transcriptional regulator with XRE-family HTH domain